MASRKSPALLPAPRPAPLVPASLLTVWSLIGPRVLTSLAPAPPLPTVLLPTPLLASALLLAALLAAAAAATPALPTSSDFGGKFGTLTPGALLVAVSPPSLLSARSISRSPSRPSASV